MARVLLEKASLGFFHHSGSKATLPQFSVTLATVWVPPKQILFTYSALLLASLMPFWQGLHKSLHVLWYFVVGYKCTFTNGYMRRRMCIIKNYCSDLGNHNKKRISKRLYCICAQYDQNIWQYGRKQLHDVWMCHIFQIMIICHVR